VSYEESDYFRRFLWKGRILWTAPCGTHSSVLSTNKQAETATHQYVTFIFNNWDYILQSIHMSWYVYMIIVDCLLCEQWFIVWNVKRRLFWLRLWIHIVFRHVTAYSLVAIYKIFRTTYRRLHRQCRRVKPPRAEQKLSALGVTSQKTLVLRLKFLFLMFSLIADVRKILWLHTSLSSLQRHNLDKYLKEPRKGQRFADSDANKGGYSPVEDLGLSWRAGVGQLFRIGGHITSLHTGHTCLFTSVIYCKGLLCRGFFYIEVIDMCPLF